MAERDGAEWHGSYLDEDGLVAEILNTLNSDPEALTKWRDPVSWRMPVLPDGSIDMAAPAHAGCLAFAGMGIRNWYGLWHPENPYTLNEGPDLEIKKNIITDPRFADNLSGRVMDRVREAIKEV